jgi:hypothetical protein
MSNSRVATFTAAIAASLPLLLIARPAEAQLVASYQFNNTLAADQGGAPALTAINSGFFTTGTVFGQSRNLYQRTSASNVSSAQSALQLDTAPLALTANNYAVELVFTFTDNLDSRGVNGYRRVVDSYDPSSLQDPGFYVGPNSLLDIYQAGSHAGGPSLTDGSFYDVVLSVSPTGEQAYLNGAQVVNYAGTPDAIATHFLTFFQDESFEYGNGQVALVRVFDRALTSGEVSTLNNNGSPFASASAPEPSSIALLLLPVVGAIVARRRKSL